MTAKASYTRFHPRWYRLRIPVFWWVRRRSYLMFVLREVSSVFIAWAVVFLLLLVNAVAQGPQDYRRFLDWAATPWVVLLNAVTLAFVLLHSVTWLFTLSPHAMALRVRGRRVPAVAIGVGNLAAWLLVTAAVALLILE